MPSAARPGAGLERFDGGFERRAEHTVDGDSEIGRAAQGALETANDITRGADGDGRLTGIGHRFLLTEGR
jgi:hypothetical protein